jgi:hypothetical protein
MNKSKRKKLRSVIMAIEKLGSIKNIDEAMKVLAEANDKVNDVEEEESFSYDNLPDNLTHSQLADDMSDNLLMLTEVQSDLETVICYYNERGLEAHKDLTDEVSAIINNCSWIIER